MEYQKLEEMEETILDIHENLEKLKFKKLKIHPIFERDFEIGTFTLQNFGKKLAKKIELPQSLILTNPDQNICTLLSNKIKLKIIVKIELRLTKIVIN